MDGSDYRKQLYEHFKSVKVLNETRKSMGFSPVRPDPLFIEIPRSFDVRELTAAICDGLDKNDLQEFIGAIPSIVCHFTSRSDIFEETFLKRLVTDMDLIAKDAYRNRFIGVVTICIDARISHSGEYNELKAVMSFAEAHKNEVFFAFCICGPDEERSRLYTTMASFLDLERIIIKVKEDSGIDDLIALVAGWGYSVDQSARVVIEDAVRKLSASNNYSRSRIFALVSRELERVTVRMAATEPCRSMIYDADLGVLNPESEILSRLLNAHRVKIIGF